MPVLAQTASKCPSSKYAHIYKSLHSVEHATSPKICRQRMSFALSDHCFAYLIVVESSIDPEAESSIRVSEVRVSCSVLDDEDIGERLQVIERVGGSLG
jgi:hypothetical protein